MDVKQASKALGISERAVRWRLQTGALPGLKGPGGWSIMELPATGAKAPSRGRPKKGKVATGDDEARKLASELGLSGARSMASTRLDLARTEAIKMQNAERSGAMVSSSILWRLQDDIVGIIRTELGPSFAAALARYGVPAEVSERVGDNLYSQIRSSWRRELGEE